MATKAAERLKGYAFVFVIGFGVGCTWVLVLTRIIDAAIVGSR